MDSRNRTVELAERLARVIANEGHAHGLKPAQWETLRYLSRANRFSRTPGALTAWLGSTKGTVSQTVMSLERAGLVEKSANPGDGRSVRLALTPAGAALLEQDQLANLRATVDALPDRVRQGLETGLEALLSRQLAANGGRPFGLCRTCRHFAQDSAGTGRHYCDLLHMPLTDTDAGQICFEQQAA
jgi:DNA-binding MarR family transcriptional regulator